MTNTKSEANYWAVGPGVFELAPSTPLREIPTRELYMASLVYERREDGLYTLHKNHFTRDEMVGRPLLDTLISNAHAKAHEIDQSMESITTKVKKLVVGTRVRFLYYRKKELWYEVTNSVPSREYFNDPKCAGNVAVPVFIFPVPIDDTGDGQFNAEDKALIFMRYIRKHVEALEEEKSLSQAPAIH